MALLLAPAPCPAAGQVPTLVKDINAAPETQGSSPGLGVEVGGIYYFAASTFTLGRELWKSDGTTGGTVLVKDVWSGSGGSYPYNLVNASGTLYFTAYDEVNGQELWKSDGTAAGTVLVKDIRSGSSGSYPYNLVNASGTLYFTAYDGVNGEELWKSDGTAAGTVLVKDIWPGSGTSSPWNLVDAGGTLYFTANDGVHGKELWKSDGTAAGTVLVADLTGDIGDSAPTSLTVVGNQLFFNAMTEATGTELFVLALGTAPAIISQPAHIITACGAGTANFGVAVSGQEPLAYQWLFNGGVIPGATGTNHTVGAVTPATAGGYSLVVTNSHGAITSVVAMLTLTNQTPTVVAADTFNAGPDGTLVIPPSALMANDAPGAYHCAHFVLRFLA